MDISCDVIRDILPLYAEDMVSPATRVLVDEHLCGCDGCAKELGRLKKAEKLPVDTDVHALKRVGATLRRRRLLTALCAVVTLVSLVWSGMVFLTRPIYLSARQAVESVELRGDGGIAVDMARGQTGTGSFQVNIGGTDVVLMWATSTRYDWLKGQQEDRALAARSQEELDQTIRERYQIAQVTQADRERFNGVYTLYWYVNSEGTGNLFYTTVSEDFPDGPWNQMDPALELWYVDEDGRTLTRLWCGTDSPLAQEEVYEELRLILDSRDDTQQQVQALFCAVLAAAVGALVGARYCRHPKLRSGLTVLGTALACLAAAIAISFGFDLTDPLGSRIPYYMDNHLLTVTALLTASALLWQRLYRQEKIG